MWSTPAPRRTAAPATSGWPSAPEPASPCRRPATSGEGSPAWRPTRPASAQAIPRSARRPSSPRIYARLSLMHETAEDVAWLQDLLDRSYESAGDHLRSITTPPRRIPAGELGPLLPGVQIIDLATVTTKGLPRAGPVDGL